MTTKKASLVFFAFMILLLILSACLPTDKGITPPPLENSVNPDTEEEIREPRVGGELIYGTIASPTIINTLYSQDSASSAVESLIYDTLVTTNEKLEPIPRMAESWETSEDGLTWTFNLRKDIKFHDGEEMTAEDVVFTYSIPLSPDYTGPRASSFNKIESIEALDDYTVEIKLKVPYAPFLMQVPASHGILPKHILGEVPIAKLGEHEFNTRRPIGTGPYLFGEWVKGQYVKVNAFDNYYLSRPYLDSVTFKIVPDQNSLLAQLQAGDIHFMTIPVTDLETMKEWENKGNIKISSTLALSYTFLGYNQKNELFQDPKVRQALTHAIDRNAIVDALLNGEGQVAHSPVSPLSWAYDPTTPQLEYNPEKAKKLLEEAGWLPGEDGILEKDGKRFSFEIKTNQGNKAREDTAVVVQQYLKEIGIETEIRIVEMSSFISEITAPQWKYDAVILGWSLGADPDPSAIWHSKEIEKGLNFVHYNNPEIDQMIEQSTSMLNLEERQQVLREIYSKISADQPYTFLYYPNEHLAMPSYLEGFVHHPGNPLYNIEKWWYYSK